MVEKHHYRGYRLVPAPQDEGWRVDVYPPGSKMAELVISCDGALVGQEIALGDARWTVDRLLDPR